MAEATSTTGFRLERLKLDPDEIPRWGDRDPKLVNWPVVYVLSSQSEVYVGETRNAVVRMMQHLDSEERRRLRAVRVVLGDRFNKSACLDLESFLIRMFSGDGKFEVLNSNAGVTDADYYDRPTYQEVFPEVFEVLRRDERLFEKAREEIENSALFKLSPFKALNQDQASAVRDIVRQVVSDARSDRPVLSVVRGGPGTGKTVVAIYLVKLLEDIKSFRTDDSTDQDSPFSEFFEPEVAGWIEDFRIGLVVPQQSLRRSIEDVFKRTPGLDKAQVLTPFQVGKSLERFDVLIVDEAHRLNQRANQPSGMQNREFKLINERLFGHDDPGFTQLDWLQKQSDQLILMLDEDQSVRPADLPEGEVASLINIARKTGRHHVLKTQMRIRADQDYVGYVRRVLSDDPPLERQEFDGYDLRMFDDLGEMRREIFRREREADLARLVAGFAWPWNSKPRRNGGPREEFDIELDGLRLKWNSTDKNWIGTENAIHEVGSVHTVQGYDLNYAGVIIGKDLRYDPRKRRLFFDRENYFDVKGRENNTYRGITYSDDDILRFIRNIYGVLLTRGILGTYIYVCDLHLREYMRQYF